MLLVVSEERRYVWPGLADNEMVDVEELCEAGERRFTFIEGVAGCLPVLECDLTLGRGYGEPRDNSTGFVLAEEGIWAVVNCSRRIRGESSGPDKLCSIRQVWKRLGMCCLPHSGLSDS